MEYHNFLGKLLEAVNKHLAASLNTVEPARDGSQAPSHQTIAMLVRTINCRESVIACRNDTILELKEELKNALTNIEPKVCKACLENIEFGQHICPKCLDAAIVKTEVAATNLCAQQVETLIKRTNGLQNKSDAQAWAFGNLDREFKVVVSNNEALKSRVHDLIKDRGDEHSTAPAQGMDTLADRLDGADNSIAALSRDLHSLKDKVESALEDSFH